MAVTPLTATQQEAVDALVAARRIEEVVPDQARARAFLAAAADRIGQMTPSLWSRRSVPSRGSSLIPTLSDTPRATW